MKLKQFLIFLAVVCIILTVCDGKKKKTKKPPKKKNSKTKKPVKHFPPSPFTYQRLRGGVCPRMKGRVKKGKHIKVKENCRVICDRMKTCVAYGFRKGRLGVCKFYFKECFRKSNRDKMALYVKMVRGIAAFKNIIGLKNVPKKCNNGPGTIETEATTLRKCFRRCAKQWWTCGSISWDLVGKKCYVNIDRCAPWWPEKMILKPWLYVRMVTPRFAPEMVNGEAILFSSGKIKGRRTLKEWTITETPTRGLCGYSCLRSKCLEFQFDYGSCLLKGAKKFT